MRKPTTILISLAATIILGSALAQAPDPFMHQIVPPPIEAPNEDTLPPPPLQPEQTTFQPYAITHNLPQLTGQPEPVTREQTISGNANLEYLDLGFAFTFAMMEEAPDGELVEETETEFFAEPAAQPNIVLLGLADGANPTALVRVNNSYFTLQEGQELPGTPFTISKVTGDSVHLSVGAASRVLRLQP